MTELTSDERKTVELNILGYLRTICEENKLRYYLMGGTLLGAVRHKGFIPWDDDIDVMMPREDYDKLMGYFREHPNDRYILADWHLQKDYSFPFGKLMDTNTILISDTVKTPRNAGAFVDIMPIDHIVDSDDLIARRKELSRYDVMLKYFYRLLPVDFHSIRKSWNWKEFLVYSSYYVRGRQYLINKYDEICKRYNSQKTDYYATIAWIYYDREIYTKEIFGEGKLVQFEKEFFNAPEHYHDFLTTVFGDYMQLPPPEKRISGHHFRVYWKREPHAS